MLRLFWRARPRPALENELNNYAALAVNYLRVHPVDDYLAIKHFELIEQLAGEHPNKGYQTLMAICERAVNH